MTTTRVAAIDCGTNSIRLLVADVDTDAGTLVDLDRRMEIVRLGHRARERAFDREHAERDRSGGRRLHDRLEARQGDELGAVSEEPVAGCGTVRAVASGIGDAGCRVGIGWYRALVHLRHPCVCGRSPACVLG